jgi:hypothetical protein
MKKETRRFNVEELKQRRERVITLKVNGGVYDLFQKIMREQHLKPSAILNQFMKLTNDLLQEEDGGEIAFVFEPIKKEEEAKNK